MVDTGKIDTTNAVVIGVEAATVVGPLTLQSEYFNSVVRSHQFGTRNFGGLYVSGNVFLTGENRPYDRAKGVFGHVTPLRDFSLRQRQIGALEWGPDFPISI